MKKVLIIEDDKELNEEITDILKFEGYDVIACQNGTMGIEIAQKCNPDIILCDIIMPGISGFDVLGEMRKNKKTSMIPFIIITALDKHKNHRRCMEMGADDYLIKPFSRNELINTLKARLLKYDLMSENLLKVIESFIYSLPDEFMTPVNSKLDFDEIMEDELENMVMEDISVMGTSVYESEKEFYRIIGKYLIFIDLEANMSNRKVAVIDNVDEKVERIVFNIAMIYNRVNDYRLNIRHCKIEVVEYWFFFAIKELLENAFKFSSVGQQVTVESKSSGDITEISIKDEGGRFPEEIMRQIGLFAQFDRKKTERKGIGMGLFMAKRIIELHNGLMKIVKHNGNGSDLVIQIPCKN